MQSLAIRRKVEKILRESVPDRVWEYLDEYGLVEDVEVGGSSVEKLASDVRKHKVASAAWSAKPPKRLRGSGPARGPERQWALSQIVAVDIAQHERVTSFRASYLPDGLLDWPEVEAWIKRQDMVDGPRTTDLTVTIPHDQLKYDGRKIGGRLSPPLSRLDRGFQVQREVLDYALPDDEWVRRIAVSAWGGLGQLQRLSKWLADSCGWQPVQGTVFVLAGIVPLISVVRSTAPLAGTAWRWNSRIRLDIDPAASVDEVVEAFKRVRQQQGLRGRRTISTRLARLAAFAMAEHKEKSWKLRQQLWNTQFPEWSYAHASNFRRDAITASKRLIGV